MHNQVEWNVLDVEEDEWKRQVATLDVAAAANGFPVVAGSAQTGDHGHMPRPWRAKRLPWRRIAAGLVAVLLLVAFLGYSLWLKAEQGLARIEADIANVVRLETIQAHAGQPAQHDKYTVASVDLFSNTAIAQVVVSRTLASGEVVVHREPRFYIQSATGWNRTESVTGFGAATSTLDTPHLHFVYGAWDRTAVEQVAPVAELLYVQLSRATGQKLTATGQLTVEVVPTSLTFAGEFDDGRLLVKSPILYPQFAFMSTDEVLVHLIYEAMCTSMLSAAVQEIHVKPQWWPLLEGLRDCLRSLLDAEPRSRKDAQSRISPTYGAVFSAFSLRLCGSASKCALFKQFLNCWSLAGEIMPLRSDAPLVATNLRASSWQDAMPLDKLIDRRLDSGYAPVQTAGGAAAVDPESTIQAQISIRISGRSIPQNSASKMHAASLPF